MRSNKLTPVGGILKSSPFLGEKEFFHVPQHARIFFIYKPLAGIFFELQHFFLQNMIQDILFTSCCRIFLKIKTWFAGNFFQTPPPEFKDQMVGPLCIL